MTKKPKTVQEFARMGGRATLKKYGKKHFAKLGRRRQQLKKQGGKK